MLHPADYIAGWVGSELSEWHCVCLGTETTAYHRNNNLGVIIRCLAFEIMAESENSCAVPAEKNWKKLPVFVFFNNARYSFTVVLHWKLCFKFGSICMLFGCLRYFYSIFYFFWYWMSKLRKYFKTIHSQLRIQYLFVLFTLLFMGSIYLIH